MNKIVLYDQEDFLGESKQFVRNVPDLALKMFNDTAKSARVEGLHWVAYKDADYKGEFIIFAPGDYTTLGPNFRYKLSSLRLVEEELLNPEIVLYEDVDYKGEHRGVKKEADNLQRADFNNLVSSHQVKQGVWILHQGYNQTRARLITFKGDKWRSYFDYGWNDKLSSLRPLENSYTEVGASPSVRLEHTSCGM
ncbi:epidermal differentiation-specific protein-like [Amblyraja radiata]|uniref:epidermal differentiation-specific protein-like n=1 Tax=Amblyraja radiata TaxID=386614 RepID=UPI001403F468|nr:epidermal differentiation-specific protein-like [Amblyraja radiata]